MVDTFALQAEEETPFDQLRNLEVQRVLKNEKYLVLRVARDGQSFVCKISHDDGPKLESEVERIEKLRQQYAGLARLMPEIVSSGTIEDGVHRGKRFYLQTLAPGRTLTDWLRSGEGSSTELRRRVDWIVKDLIDVTLAHRPSKDGPSRPSTFFSQRFWESFDSIKTTPLLADIIHADEIVIDGRAYRSLGYCLDAILSSQAIGYLDQIPSELSDLGHWNFHGDNIVLATLAQTDGYAVIDPDVSISLCDPMFGLARLLYTFVHDTAAFDYHTIRSSFYLLYTASAAAFEIELDWPRNSAGSYQSLFSGSDGGMFGDPIVAGKARLMEPSVALRLELCRLYCLLRGVKVNYVPRLRYINQDPTLFCNRTIFLFLQAVVFANRLTSGLTRGAWGVPEDLGNA